MTEHMEKTYGAAHQPQQRHPESINIQQNYTFTTLRGGGTNKKHKRIKELSIKFSLKNERRYNSLSPGRSWKLIKKSPNVSSGLILENVLFFSTACVSHSGKNSNNTLELQSQRHGLTLLKAQEAFNGFHCCLVLFAHDCLEELNECVCALMLNKVVFKITALRSLLISSKKIYNFLHGK